VAKAQCGRTLLCDGAVMANEETSLKKAVAIRVITLTKTVLLNGTKASRRRMTPLVIQKVSRRVISGRVVRVMASVFSIGRAAHSIT
jgi:hypothetical protein